MSSYSKKAASIVAKDLDGKYLMQFRDSGGGRSNPRNALTWGFFGGHYEDDESPAAALIREFEEETTIRVSENELAYLGEGVFDDTLIALYAMSRPVSWSEIEVREGAGAGFFTRAELEQLPLAGYSDGLIRKLL